MKTSDLVIGAAVVAVGFIVWRSMRPAQPSTVPAAPPSSGLTWEGVVGGAVGGLAAIGAQRLGEALRGEREWW